MAPDITLFELNFPDAEFNAPFSGQSPTDDESTAESWDDELAGAAEDATANGDDGGHGALLGLIFAIGLALAVRAIRDRRREEPEGFEDAPETDVTDEA